MAGKKGMVQKNTRTNTLRDRAWNTLRKGRRYTIYGLLTTCTAEEITKKEYQNVKRWMHYLHRHGYVCKTGAFVSGRAGETQCYIIARGGIARPTICDVCGLPIYVGGCNPDFFLNENKKRD